jgi:hypothetical protein
MIDRTTFDLGIAKHRTTTSQVNRQGWQRQDQPGRRTCRAALASALVALAAWLAPASTATRPPGEASQEQTTAS